MHILNIAKATKKMEINEVKYFIFKNSYERIVIIQGNLWKKKDLLLHANKLIEKIPDPRNAKEDYQLYIRKKNRKSGKQSEIIENSNIVDTKSIIKEHPKTLHKLS